MDAEVPFKAYESMKRKQEEGENSLSEDGDERPLKKRHVDTQHRVLDIVDDKTLKNLDPEEINKFVESAADVEVEELDSAGMKRLVAAFERAYTKNQQMRTKFPEEPEKFLESEVDLDEAIKKLHALAAAPELYPEFIKIEAHVSVLSLLSHENTDIIVDAIELINELCNLEEDSKPSDYEACKMLVDAFVKQNALELLVQTLNRLDEKEESEKQGVYNLLSIIENFTEVNIELCQVLGEKTEILQWLLKRIQQRQFDDIKLYCSEILSILLQNSKDNQIKVGKLNGIDVLLTAVSLYKKINPPTMEEEEMVENLFDCLCLACALPENKPYFIKAEGLNLLQIMIKNKKFCRKSALKLLDYCLLRDPDNCRRWVELPALGTLFAAFMRKGAQKHKKGFSEKEDDEHTISCIVSLFVNLEQDSKLWSRVLEKFREENMEKVERLLELHEKYLAKVKVADKQIKQQKIEYQKQGHKIDEDDEEEFYLQRLDAGLFTLQLVDFVIAIICNADPKIKENVQRLLKLQNSSFNDVKEILHEYANNLGSAVTEEQTRQEKERIIKLANEL
jgi:beta-catenin-like protein 1